MKQFILYLLTGLFVAWTLTLTGCANIIPPSGGPRDSIPPVLMHASPPDSTKQFPGGKIVLTFNEYVELDKPLETIIVSPLPKYQWPTESHLRTVTIRIKDTLEPNTTYSIDFGRSIRDINEANALKDFTYVFTTGNHFDSLEFAGKVIVAQTGKPDSTLVVMLHQKLEDSAVANERPRYYARLDSGGNFRFHNLPSGIFAVYALEDQGGMKRYTSPKQLFAFADSPVVISASTHPVILFAYAQPEEEKSTTSPSSAGKSAGKSPVKALQDKVIRVTSNLENGQLDLLSQLEVVFSSTIKTMDTSKARLTNEVFEPTPNVRYELDSTRKKLSIQTNWLPNRGYHLIVAKDFVEDSTGRKLIRTDTVSFRTKSTSDYGSLKLRFLNLDLSKHPLLQFVRSGEIKYTHVFTDRNVNIKLFQPGDYELRILYDDNRNGKWDPGDFFGKHKQPEKVQPLQRKLDVKPNWDTEVDITL